MSTCRWSANLLGTEGQDVYLSAACVMKNISFWEQSEGSNQEYCTLAQQRFAADVMFTAEPYVHVVTEQGTRSVLEPTLVGGTVQNARKQRVQRQLLLLRGVIQAPAPAAAVRRWREQKKKHLLSKIPAWLHTEWRWNYIHDKVNVKISQV